MPNITKKSKKLEVLKKLKIEDIFYDNELLDYLDWCALNKIDYPDGEIAVIVLQKIGIPGVWKKRKKTQGKQVWKDLT